MTIRKATTKDEGFLVENRRHISATLMKEKISKAQIYVAESNGEITGWARYGLFWDNMPFLNMIHVLASHRNRGIGSALMAAWEQDMKNNGHAVVLTSTQSDENAQHFYRKLGYRDCGVIMLPKEPAELILIKHLAQAEQDAAGNSR